MNLSVRNRLGWRVIAFTVTCFAIASEAGRHPQGVTLQAGERHPNFLIKDDALRHREAPDEYSIPPAMPMLRFTSSPGRSVRGPYVSVQVNVNADGQNILWDAANEPSIAVDPNNPLRMAIGWRQFDTIQSSFRQAGWGYSQDGGQTWTFPGVLEPGVFRSDPVLGFDAEGNFYYNSLSVPNQFVTHVFKSTDGGRTWGSRVFAFGGDKQWMTIDRTDGIGRGRIYQAWSPFSGCCGAQIFNRSTNDASFFESPVIIPLSPHWGTLSVDPDGQLYVGGIGEASFAVARSGNAKDSDAIPWFELTTAVDLGGFPQFGGGPNPGGLLGQVWVATDHSSSVTRGNVYLLSSVGPPISDPLDVMFARSTDGNFTWSPPVRINDDPPNNGAWQWFGTMSVAPNGRIDVIWNDTRNTGAANLSELFYSFSTDGGVTWSKNVAVSEVFNSHVGWPMQNKIGDYYDMVSDNSGVNVAYAATFTGGHDVYFLRIGELDCNHNGVADSADIATGTSDDCNENDLPDECEPDCNGNDVADACDIVDEVSPDCDGNFVPDECDPDFDHDGLIDNCDDDSDNDGILNDSDDCPFTPLGMPVQANGRPLGDTNGNCGVDLTDYWRFHRCLGLPGTDTMPDAQACIDVFDYNGDSQVNLKDFAGFQNVFTGD